MKENDIYSLIRKNLIFNLYNLILFFIWKHKYFNYTLLFNYLLFLGKLKSLYKILIVFQFLD